MKDIRPPMVKCAVSGEAYASTAPSRPDSEAHMYLVPQDVRRVAFRLGLGDLNAPPRCKSFQNGCTCSECAAQQKLINEHRAAGRRPFTPDGLIRKRPEKPQPWQTKETA